MTPSSTAPCVHQAQLQLRGAIAVSFDLPMFQCCAVWGHHHHLPDWQWPSPWEIRYVLAVCLALSCAVCLSFKCCSRVLCHNSACVSSKAAWPMPFTHRLALCRMSDVVLSTLPLALKCVSNHARNHVLCLSAQRHMVMDSASLCCRGQLQQQPKGKLLSYRSLQLRLISSYCLS